MCYDDNNVRLLVERYLSNSMNERDLKDWLDLTNRHPGLVGELYDHIILDEMIRDVSRGGYSDSALAKVVAEMIEYRDRPWYYRHPLASTVLSLAVVLPLVLVAGLIFLRQPIVHEIVQPVKVAVLLDGADTIWEKRPEMRGSLRFGGDLYEETLFLRSGLAKIRFQNGAIVLLEGPSEFQLVSPDRAVCHYGRVSAVVPPEAIGFRIDVRETSVIDLGTIFMIEVTDSTSEIQVQDGRVALTEPSLEKAVLDQKQAARFFSDGPPRIYHADTSHCKRIKAMAEAESEELARLYNEELARRAQGARVLLPDCTLIAQRGKVTGLVENTIPSFRAAVEFGVDACEFDVTAAGDGTLFVIHPDRAFLKPHPGAKDIESTPFDKLTSEEIKAMDAQSRTIRPEGTRIPTLEEILDFFRTQTGCHVVIDVFETKDVPAVIDALERSGIGNRVILTGRHSEQVRKLKELRPSLCVGLCCDRKAFPPTSERQVEDIIAIAETVKADFVKLEKNILSRELIRRCVDMGIPVWCYTIDKVEDKEFCLGEGAVGILSGRSDLLLNRIAPDRLPDLDEDEEEIP